MTHQCCLIFSNSAVQYSVIDGRESDILTFTMPCAVSLNMADWMSQPHWFSSRHTECIVRLADAVIKLWDVYISTQVLPAVCELLLLWWDRDRLLLHAGAKGGAAPHPQQIPPLYLLCPLPHRYRHWESIIYSFGSFSIDQSDDRFVFSAITAVASRVDDVRQWPPVNDDGIFKGWWS